jgi:transposase
VSLSPTRAFKCCDVDYALTSFIFQKLYGIQALYLIDDAACTRGVNEMIEYTGIDVSKEKLDVGWIRDAPNGKKKTKVLNNSPQGFEALAAWLLKNTQVDPQEILITLEPTGVYHEALVYFLHALGFKIVLVNPGKAKQYAQSIGFIHKTDKTDAIMLAYYGHAQHLKLPLWQPEAPEIRELKAMMRRLDALEKDLQREKNRLETSEISNSSQRVLTSLRDIIAVLEAEVANLTDDIDHHINNEPTLKKNRELLESIKGIGRVMSREMVYLFASKRFKNAKQAAAYVGLIPILHESGKRKGRTSISKAGPARIRAKLYMAAVCASTYNPDIRAQKDRLIKAGKTPMQAIGAAMRKLIQIGFGVIKHQSEYQPQVI